MSSSTIKTNTREILNGLQILQKESPPPGQAYTVVAYILTNVIGSNGERGMIFIIGSYSSAKDAVNRAKEIVDKTGINGVYALPTCKWENIDTRYRPDRTIYTEPPKLGNTLDTFWHQSVKVREHTKSETKPSNEPEIDEWNIGTIEHYTQLWYLVTKNKGQLEDLKQQIKHRESVLAKRVDELRLAHQEHPEYEKRWLVGVERKLEASGKSKLLNMIKETHQELVKEVLPEILD